MSLGLSNIIRNRSRAASDASTANTVPSNYSNNPQPVLDFTTRIDELKKSYIGRDGNANRQHYVPEEELVKYWTNARVREISQAYTPHLTIKFDLVSKRCLRLFSILVYIDRIQFFENLQTKILDAQLPVAEDNLPQTLALPVYKEVLRDLLKHQWLFCPLVLDYALLTDLHLEADHILPFSDEEKLKDGDAAQIFKITVNKTCNQLEDQPKATEDRIYVLKSYSDERYRKLYLNESKALTTLQQPGSEHVVGYHGSFIQNGTFNLLLQFADGGSLLDYYRKTTPPSDPTDIKEFWRNLLRVLKGLYHVHQIKPKADDTGKFRGIHEDIKPDNILLNKGPSGSSYDFTPLLTDFGHSHFRVAKEEGDDMGVDRQGNQTYGAPECSKHARYLRSLPSQIPTAADIWSIGCVISDAAAWVVLGLEGRDTYRKLREERGSQVENFEDPGHYDCFHDAVDRSEAVDKMHDKIREACHPDDTITPQLLDLVQNHMLLWDWKQRLTANQVYERFRKLVWESEGKKKLKDITTTVGRLTREISGSVSFRKSEAKEKLHDKECQQEGVQNTPDLDENSISPGPIPSTSGDLMGKFFRRKKSGEREQGEDGNIQTNDDASVQATRESDTSATSPPPIKLSHSPTLPPRRPGPYPHVPNNTSSLSPISDGMGSFSEPRDSPTDGFRSPISDISTFLSPHTDIDHDRFIVRPPSPANSFEDVPLDELDITLEEAKRWRVIWKNYEQLPPDKHRIIKSIRHSLRGRDHIFFVDDSRTMKQHADEVETAFETLAYIVKPQDGKEQGNVSLALHPAAVEKGKQQKCFYTDNSKTSNLVNILKKNCTYERFETMIEDVFSDFIDREIIPRLPVLKTHRETIGSPTENGKPGSSKRASSASRNRASGQSTESANPISIIVLTNGQWGKVKDGAGVDNPIWKLVDQLKERELKRTQVMIQFVRFGDDQDGVRHLDHLAKLGRGDSENHTPGYSIVDTQPITGNVCAMLIGSIGGTHTSRNNDTAPSPNDLKYNTSSIHTEEHDQSQSVQDTHDTL